MDDVDSENAGQPEELKRLGCLRKWKSRNGAEATFKVIVEAVISSDRVDNAEAICQQLLRKAGKIMIKRLWANALVVVVFILTS